MLVRRDLFIDAPAMTHNQQEYVVSLNLVQNSIISYSQGIESFPLAAQRLSRVWIGLQTGDFSKYSDLEFSV